VVIDVVVAAGAAPARSSVRAGISASRVSSPPPHLPPKSDYQGTRHAGDAVSGFEERIERIDQVLRFNVFLQAAVCIGASDLALQPIRYKQPLAIDLMLFYISRWKNATPLQATGTEVEQHANRATSNGQVADNLGYMTVI
jgi:hypothetical protein